MSASVLIVVAVDCASSTSTEVGTFDSELEAEVPLIVTDLCEHRSIGGALECFEGWVANALLILDLVAGPI